MRDPDCPRWRCGEPGCRASAGWQPVSAMGEYDDVDVALGDLEATTPGLIPTWQTRGWLVSSLQQPDRHYVYRHIWPILDEDRPLSSLRVEASAALGPILGRLGVRPTAQPRYLVSDDRLVCEVPVLRLDGDEPQPRTDETAVLRLVQVGWSDRHIGAELGYDHTTVGRIRRDAGYEPNGQQIGAAA